MILVGEKINTSLKGVTEAVRNRDEKFIQDLAIKQAEFGADYIDVNCGTLVGTEVEALTWLVETVQKVVDKPCCVDSPDPKALEAGLSVHFGVPMINSITAEETRYNDILPLVKKYQGKIVALLIDDENGISSDEKIRIQIGEKLIDRLVADGVPMDDIYIDPLIQPISTDSKMGLVAMNTIAALHQKYPAVHFMCGLSNVSFGIPGRGLLNRTYIAMCMAAGLDGAVLDPMNIKMMSVITAGEALLDKDRFCKRYLKAHRKGTIEN